MKKLVLMAVVALFGFTATAQNFNVGVGGGIPTGDAGDFYSFTLNLDVEALWDASEEFEVGATTGYQHNFLKSEFDGDGASFLPIAAAARFNASDEFTIGADIGYGIGLSPDGNDGGFYYAPKVQYGVSDTIDIVASYRGVSVDGGTFSQIALGILFGL